MHQSTEHVAARTIDHQIACHIVEPSGQIQGTALLIHGRNGAATAPHMTPIADAYHRCNWRTVSPDLPRSGAVANSGPAKDITLRLQQLEAETVLDWLWPQIAAKDHRVALAGHSLGAYAVAELAGLTPKLDHLIAVSPVLSGNALFKARYAMGQPAIDALKREAPDMFNEMPKNDATPALNRTKVPVAVMTGSKDGLTPPSAARAYFAAAPNACFYATLKDLHHCPIGPVYEQALAAALDAVQA